jgi:acetate kinase
MTAAILVLNAGSSSLKFALYEPSELALLCRGTVGAIGGETYLKVTGPEASIFEGQEAPVHADHETAAAWLVSRFRDMSDFGLVAAGHRVVHGGSRFSAPVILDDATIAGLGELIPLAPGHQPHNLAAIHAVARAWPELPQVACFDTAFHHPAAARTALPPSPRPDRCGGSALRLSRSLVRVHRRRPAGPRG